MTAYLNLFIMFFSIGAFSFGGGMAMLPLIYQMIQKFGVMSPDKFSDLVAISQVTPGPVATNAAAYVGLDYAGIGGAAVATAAVALPSFVLMLLVLRFMKRYEESSITKGIFEGIRPATVGLIAAAVIFVAETAVDAAGGISGESEFFGIFAVTVLLSGKFHVNPIMLTVGMGILGVFICG